MSFSTDTLVKEVQLPFAVNEVRPHDSGVVVVDLRAVQANYRAFSEVLAPAKVAPVLKANAYGLGLLPVAEALHEVGVNQIFVATIDEAVSVKRYLPSLDVFVLYGLFFNTIDVFLEENVTPVLNTLEQVKLWNAQAVRMQRKLPCVIHIDTGMSRTGMTIVEAQKLAEQKHLLNPLYVKYIMSHLACAETKDHPLNDKQKQDFSSILKYFPGIPTSLSATLVGNFDASYRMDMVRVGYGLYGYIHMHNPISLQEVLHVYGRVVQVRNSLAGDNVGYGGRCTLSKDSKLATIAVGYADGYHRFLHNYDTAVYFGNYRAPLMGRISMDFIVVDVTNIPEPYVHEGAWAELIGSHIRVADLIKGTDFVPHEIPISLGNRYHKKYIK